MGIASLSNRLVIEAKSTIPAWGASYHEVTLDGEHTLSGKVELVIADLRVQCTVLSGGPSLGRSFYRLVAGSGGLGKTIASKSYANDAGVKLLTVLSDAMSAAGETLDTSSVDAQTRLGSSWVRVEDLACRTLELVSPQAWYVGEDGKVRIGRRAAKTLSITAPRTSQLDKARGMLTLASESIASILPGSIVDGLEALDVEHEFSAEKGLRTKIWGRLSANRASRRIDAMRAIFDQLDPDRRFRELSEYRVVAGTDRLELQSVRVSSGMPDLSGVPVRPGVSGAKSTLTPGSRVLVGFVSADPSRPVVLAFDDAESAGFLPIQTTIDATLLVKLGAGLLPVARGTDRAGIFPIITTQSKVLA